MGQRMKRWVGVSSALLGICVAGSVGADHLTWVIQDREHPNFCHKHLAFPFATDCQNINGYGIWHSTFIGSWERDPAGARAVALAYRSGDCEGISCTPGALWMIAADGRIMKRTGDWSNGSWVPQPRNACGTGTTINFDATGKLQNLAIDSFHDVWVIDSSNKVRFWRTSGNPDCWAVVKTVPGTGTLKSIAAFESEEGGWIWAVRNRSSYFFDGEDWHLIDNDTGSISSVRNYATNASGTWLGWYDHDTGLWNPDPTWNTSFGGSIVRLTTSHEDLSYIDWNGNVWLQ